MSIVSRLFPYISSYKRALRLVRMVVGITLLLVGIALLVLPGPAIVVIPLALAILASEFVWARVLLKRVRYHIENLQRKENGNQDKLGND